MIQNTPDQSCLINTAALSLQKIYLMELKARIEEVWKNRELLKEVKYTEAIRAVIEETDKGRLRVAE
ncbi:MAG TPA: hypothetical protein VK622_07580, partial [Puia sp.]|nr:hypothetical protein [Puia sp.]